MPCAWRLILTVSFALVSAAAHAQSAGDTVDWGRLERGDILITAGQSPSGTSGLRCLFLVSGDRESLFARIRDPAFFKATYRNIKEQRVLRRYPDGEDIEFVLDAVVETVRYTVARTVDEQRLRVSWHRLAGDLKDISGLWAVETSPLPGKCLIRYESYVDPGGRVRTALYFTVARMQARADLERLRKVLEGSSTD